MASRLTAAHAAILNALLAARRVVAEARAGGRDLTAEEADVIGRILDLADALAERREVSP